MFFQFQSMASKTYTLSVLLFTAIVASCAGESEEPVQPSRQCSGPGQICSTCDSVSVCIGNGDGSITTISQSCQPDEHCVQGLCVKGALCNYRPFQCSEEGFFPDPYDCTKYHVCAPTAVNGVTELMSFQCSDGSSYDALSASCSFPLNTTACVTRPVPECSQRLEIGAVTSNPNLYYVCVEKDGTLAPELHKCPGGLRFKASKLSCKGEVPNETPVKNKTKKSKGKGE